MKIKYYIAAIAFTGLLMTSCEKTEFTEIMEQEVTQEEARQSGDNGVDPWSGGALDPDDSIKKDDGIRPDADSGVVKEVSDGDEESDDDENTAS